MSAISPETWDDRLFSTAVGADDVGERVRVTVRRTDTGEERSGTLDPTEFATSSYPKVIEHHASKLRVALGFMSGQPFADEFRIDNFHDAIRVIHMPTGRQRILDITERGPVLHAAIRLSLLEMTGELWAAGVRPATVEPPAPHVPQKKLGKPRHADRATRRAAATE